jgi:hypothetical protein
MVGSGGDMDRVLHSPGKKKSAAPDRLQVLARRERRIVIVRS